MECLPSDIILNILSGLPVESVLDCKLVSKSLLNLLTHRWDQFAKMHSRRRQLLQLASSGGDASSSTGLLVSFIQKRGEYKTEFYYGDEYNNEMNIHDKLCYKTLQETSVSYPLMMGLNAIVGSCNGLVCVNRYDHGIPDPIHICNLSTGEYVNLPEYTKRENHYLAAFGFGYVHSMTNDQYKVVRVYYPGSNNFHNGEVQVYTIGGGSGWRTIGKTSYQLWRQNSLGTYVNGSLHWIDLKKIVAFNLADEEFRLIPSPPCHDSFNHNSFYRLQALRGNLCFCHLNNKDHLLDIWCLKQNAKEASWIREFSIAYPSGYQTGYEFRVRPLLVTKKNEVLFVHQGETLYCYDPKANTVIKLWDDDAKSE